VDFSYRDYRRTNSTATNENGVKNNIRKPKQQQIETATLYIVVNVGMASASSSGAAASSLSAAALSSFWALRRRHRRRHLRRRHKMFFF